MLTVGVGVFMHPGRRDTDEVQKLLRVSLTPVDGGVVLGLSHQLDDDEPQLAGAAEVAALREGVIAAAPRFGEYYALVAIYELWAHGKAIIAAAPNAIERRLRTLGEPLAARATELAGRLKGAGARNCTAERRLLLDKRTATLVQQEFPTPLFQMRPS